MAAHVEHLESSIVGPEGWDFPVDTEHQGSILFSHIINDIQIVLRMAPLCLNMEVSQVNERSKVKHFLYQ